MALTNKVNPGDLITAANWNALVAAVNGLSGQAQVGGITVPSFFGMTLNSAAAIIRLPSSQLNLGTVLDTLGDTIDPTQPASVNLLVLGQSPSAGVSVPAATPINLIVSPSAASPPQGLQQITVGVAEVEPGSYNGATNTITLNQGATVGAVAFSVITPNTDTYTCSVPATFGGGWGASFVTNPLLQPASAGVAIQVTVKIQPVGPASASFTFSVTSNQHQNLFQSISPTIQVATS
jgi:hypothetical protein